jgi:hypothetical protein
LRLCVDKSLAPALLPQELALEAVDPLAEALELTLFEHDELMLCSSRE